MLAAMLFLAIACPAHAGLRLDGQMTQGGMIIGHADPGAAVVLDGQPVRVAPDGRFVFGFGRDAPPSAVLQVSSPDGQTEQRILAIAQRRWDIQRIDGLPPSKVTPPPGLAERLKRERAAIGAARRHVSDAMFWAETLVWPSRGRISGVYGSQRILNGVPKQPHYGVDVAGPKGSPVSAPTAGIVTLAESDFYYEGGIVIIDHGYGVSSTLIHMERVDVKTGESVGQGQRIGLLGAAGRASGPHLDWRINWNGVRLDPALAISPMPDN
ncbi:M23 family metallopeptidase [Emcibacter sp. SYSU 3D8]|uniref:M23 family metallopeptidase n=1 Tax=Emcibacter sp. SYSU 3D8 TaxID=3133969 RepID=UPI0031FEC0EC